MDWLFFAVIAQIILGTSAVFDKFLLQRKFFDPWVYTFWIAILGLGAFVLSPFGFTILPLFSLILAIATGAVLVVALFLLFYAVNKGDVSTIFIFIGSVSPIATFLFSWALLGSQLRGGNFVGFFLLVAGGLILFWVEKKELRLSILPFLLASSAFFALYFVLAKLVFEQSSFISGLIWIKFGGALFVFTLLAIPYVRKKVSSMSRVSTGKQRLLYIGNIVYAGIGSTLVALAISLAHPALVDATQSIKYIVIFLVAWVLLRERPYGTILAGKITATLLVVVGLLWFGIGEYARNIPINPNRQVTWGVTFSSKFSKELGLDWQENFRAILYEVQPRKIRLVAYWDEIEKTRGEFDFSDLDWQIDMARQSGTKVILAVGMKVPRWPECHIPNWIVREFSISNFSAKGGSSPEANAPREHVSGGQFSNEREEALLKYMRAVVERYKYNPAIAMWQVENEPFLLFGKCPERSGDFLDREIALVKSIDPSRPVLITDGGEFGLWFKAASKGDVFGTTMYRKVYPRFIGPIVGTVEYPISPSFFRLKEKIIRNFSAVGRKKFIVVELQAEPWGSELLPNLPYKEQKKIFDREYFLETINFAQATGFDEYYLWGAEWWYWLKIKQGDDSLWEEAKTLFKK